MDYCVVKAGSALLILLLQPPQMLGYRHWLLDPAGNRVCFSYFLCTERTVCITQKGSHCYLILVYFYSFRHRCKCTENTNLLNTNSNKLYLVFYTCMCACTCMSVCIWGRRTSGWASVWSEYQVYIWVCKYVEVRCVVPALLFEAGSLMETGAHRLTVPWGSLCFCTPNTGITDKCGSPAWHFLAQILRIALD